MVIMKIKNFNIDDEIKKLNDLQLQLNILKSIDGLPNEMSKRYIKENILKIKNK